MPVLQAMIFDLDGTLVDSMSDLRNALNATLNAHKRRRVTMDEFKSFYGDGMRFIIRRSFAATGVSISDAEAEDLFKEFVAHYQSQEPDPRQTYPYAAEMLEALKTAGVKIGICTLKPERASHWLLNKLGLVHYFNCIGGGDTFPVAKPDPGHLLGVIERMGVDPKGCVMVGDGLNDMRMASSANVARLLVDFDRRVDFNAAHANGLIYSFKGYREAIEGIGFTVP